MRGGKQGTLPPGTVPSRCLLISPTVSEFHVDSWLPSSPSNQRVPTEQESIMGKRVTISSATRAKGGQEPRRLAGRTAWADILRLLGQTSSSQQQRSREAAAASHDGTTHARNAGTRNRQGAGRGPMRRCSLFYVLRRGPAVRDHLAVVDCPLSYWCRPHAVCVTTGPIIRRRQGIWAPCAHP